MRIVGRQALMLLAARGEQARKWAAGWSSEVAAAAWRTPADLFRQFPRARQAGPDTFQFPMHTDDFALQVRIRFQNQVVLVMEPTLIAQDH